MSADCQPHAPRCVQCGREKRRNDLSAWCPLCERRKRRQARLLGYALVAAVTAGETERAERIARHVVSLTTIN